MFGKLCFRHYSTHYLGCEGSGRGQANPHGGRRPIRLRRGRGYRRPSEEEDAPILVEGPPEHRPEKLGKGYGFTWGAPKGVNAESVTRTPHNKTHTRSFDLRSPAF